MTATRERRVDPAPISFRPDSRLDSAELCIHALAQVGDEIHLELPARSGGVDLTGIARAYGIGHRVHSTDDSVCRFIGADGAATVDDRAPIRRTLGEIVESLPAGRGTAIAYPSGEELRGHRIVVLTNYPTHYRLPLFELMSAAAATEGAELKVLFLSAGAPSRPWLVGPDIRFDHAFVPSVRMPVRRQRRPLVPAKLERTLRSLRPTIVLSAGLSPFVSDRAERVARERGAAFGIWSGETDQTAPARSRLRLRLRQRLVSRADFAVAYGARSAGYLRGLRSDLPLVIGRNTAPVNTAVHGAQARRGDTLQLVVIGDLADRRKGVDVALAALRLLPEYPLQLSVVGGGRLLGPLAETASTDPRVTFLGPLPPGEVSHVLAGADALLFPTRSDVFGLALVEAMGAGVLPLVSRAAGAVDDLAVDGHNAAVIDGHDPATWAAAIEDVQVDPAKRREIAQRARATIAARWSLTHAAAAMLAGLRLCALTRSEEAR